MIACLVLFFCPRARSAQDEAAWSATPSVAVLLAEARKAEAHFDPTQALALFRQADVEQPNDPLIIQAISKQLSDRSDTITTNRAARLAMIEESLVAAKRAADLAPRNALCVLSVAVCEGKLARDADNRERIQAARLTKSWADAALELDPKNDWAEHVLGTWALEVSKIGATKRALARMLYGEVPEASVADAIRHLQKAVLLGPAVPLHHLELGFAYQENGDKNLAQKELRAGLALPSLGLPDELAKAKARAVLRE